MGARTDIDYAHVVPPSPIQQTRFSVKLRISRVISAFCVGEHRHAATTDCFVEIAMNLAAGTRGLSHDWSNWSELILEKVQLLLHFFSTIVLSRIGNQVGMATAVFARRVGSRLHSSYAGGGGNAAVDRVLVIITSDGAGVRGRAIIRRWRYRTVDAASAYVRSIPRSVHTKRKKKSSTRIRGKRLGNVRLRPNETPPRVRHGALNERGCGGGDACSLYTLRAHPSGLCYSNRARRLTARVLGRP
jgi:hypothetical protein